jgi:hypothetical protein
MDLPTVPEIRKSFVNATKGEASRINLPDDFDQWTPERWTHTDFLGWVDPRAPQHATIVAPDSGGGLVGVRLRRNTGGGGRAKMCSICCTMHPGSGVALMVAARAGKSGRDGNTVGLDVCADLQCPGYVRGWLPAPTLTTLVETLPLEDRVARMWLNLESFLRRVRR